MKTITSVIKKKIFVWRKKKSVQKIFVKKKFHLNIQLHTWDGIFVKNKYLANEEEPTKNLHIYQHLQISMFFDICDLTMRTESPILLLSSPLQNLMWTYLMIYYYYYLPPLKKIFIFPKKILKFAKKNFRECFASFLCIRKKERKILLCKVLVEWTYGHFLAIFSTLKIYRTSFGILSRFFSPVLFKINSKTTFQRKKLKKKLQKVWYFFFSLLISLYTTIKLNRVHTTKNNVAALLVKFKYRKKKSFKIFKLCT